MNAPNATADIHYLVGSWEAEVENPNTGTKLRLTYMVEPTLEGRWLTGFGEARELQLTVRDMWGHDPVTGEIVRSGLRARARFAMSPPYELPTTARRRGSTSARARRYVAAATRSR